MTFYTRRVHVTTDFRRTAKALQDGLSQEDAKWYLCRRTGRSYQDLLAIAAECTGDLDQFCKAIGYKNLRRQNKYDDFGWWSTICAWLRMHIPQHDKFFRETVTRLADEQNALIPVLDQERILAVAAQALNIAPEVLLHFAQHREEIELFLELQRKTLGTIAEAKLWELVMAGDAPTIRWLLPRVKQELFGDKLTAPPGDAPRTIKIIEGD